ISVYFLKHDPRLIERRMRVGPLAEQRPSQKINGDHLDWLCSASRPARPGLSLALLERAALACAPGQCGSCAQLCYPLHRAQAKQLCGFDGHSGSGSAGGLDRSLCDREAPFVFGRPAVTRSHAIGARIVLDHAGHSAVVSGAGLAAARRGTLSEADPARFRAVLPRYTFSPGSMGLVATCPSANCAVRNAATKPGIAGSISRAPRTIRISSSSGCFSRARCARTRSRRVLASSVERKTLISAISGPLTTMVHPASASKPAISRPVSSLSSRATLRSRSTLSPTTSSGSGVPHGK